MTEAGNKRTRDDAEGTSVQAEQEGETKLIIAITAETFCARRLSEGLQRARGHHGIACLGLCIKRFVNVTGHGVAITS